MNGLQNGKHLNLEKPIPGCLGSLVNIFDLSTVARNKLLTDKPHCEGSPLSRSHSDVARMSPSGDAIEDKVTMSGFRRTYSNKKPNGTPMKMLIDQEMSKEIDSVDNTPSLVAKLMGLDALPRQQPNIAAQRSHSVAYSRSSDTPSNYWKENGYLETEVPHEFERYPGQKEYKDIYETWQQSRSTNSLRDKSPNKGRYDDTVNDKNMALVRQKFMEAKRLATDEKLRQSKQFQDALEVLSANKDSFLKFLQEPNSLFSQHLYTIQSIPHPPETKRITVLKPSKMLDSSKFPGKNDEKYTKKTARLKSFDNTHIGFSPPVASGEVDGIPSQPTRIVVLKPSPGKPHDGRAMGSPPSASPVISRGEEYFGDSERNAVQESREVAKSITQQMRETLSRHRRDETLLSSVLSNGYIGDESSFNKSEIEHATGNLSDSEVMSPVSRHSWDYINRVDSPYSCSSFSRASYSPESSVGREAKKRLSERWAMMASNGSCQEPKHFRRSSSTLGEMLALSDVKGSGRFEDETMNREEHRASSSFLHNSNLTKDEGIDKSPRNLLRSKSVPVSSTAYGSRMNVDVSDPEGKKSEVPQDSTKARNSKSSFKGKVSSFFFSRTKKSNKEQSRTSQTKGQSEVSFGSHGKINDGTEQHDNLELKSSSLGLPASSSKASSPRLNDKQCVISPEAGLIVKNPLASGNIVENQDQPSPISVLELPFEGDEHTVSESSYKADGHGLEVSDYPTKSNLIDKSPPIGSIARTLSWDDSCVDTASSYPLTTSLSTRGAADEEEEWLLFVQTLLSVAGLDNELQLARWHSPESPLDPSLRDNYIDLNDKKILQEAKRRQRRSTQKLVFDCVNAAIIDIAGYGSDTCQHTIPYGGSHSLKIADQVWSRMKEWFSGEMRCVSGDSGDINSLVVENVVRKEVVGKGWAEHLRLEMDILGNEIETKLLEELVQETVIEMTDRR